jgi:N-acetylated-alpha-linked acidic dipeptidase
VKERRYAKAMVSADRAARTKLMGDKSVKLSALGAGSDYSPFLQHLGIASMDLGYGGEGQGGQYHSIYDSYYYFTKFVDPGFAYGVALSKTAGRTILRLADAEVLPIDFNSFYKTVNGYVTELKTLLENSRTETEQLNKLVKDSLYELAKDPTKQYKSPVAKDDVPFMNFSSVENKLVELQKASDDFQKLYPKALHLPADKLNQLNAILYKAERSLVQPNGLPRRAWYRHQIYAPGYYTGYGVKTLPGIREGIEERHWKEAQDNIEIVAKTLDAYVQQVNAANALLK